MIIKSCNQVFLAKKIDNKTVDLWWMRKDKTIRLFINDCGTITWPWYFEGDKNMERQVKSFLKKS